MSAAWFTIEEANRWLDAAAEAVANNPFARHRLADIVYAKGALLFARDEQMRTAAHFAFEADRMRGGAYPDCKARVLCFCGMVLQARVDAMDAGEGET